MVTTDKVTVTEFTPHIGKTTTDYKENDMERKPIQQGWQCPICGRILSPWTWECPCGGNGGRYTTSDRTNFKAEWTNKDALEIHKGAGKPKW